mmetsp:Transcript_28495/g.43624  ORF Transcript_28495/g.43624 Transcript_28495/m.43624 type:complete len:524 (-) Transcript_28495:149-1720(-)
MSSIAQVKKWSEKYPFDENEIEIILRCYSSIVRPKEKEFKGQNPELASGADASDTKTSFLNLLAHAFPYVFFFLPSDEIKTRISLVEKSVLPSGFGERFQRAIFPPPSPSVSSTVPQRLTETEEIEGLIQGLSNCCGGDTKDTLGIIFDSCQSCHTNNTSSVTSPAESRDDDKHEHHETCKLCKPLDLIEMCYRLSVAAETVAAPNLNEKSLLEALSLQEIHHHGLTQSLTSMARKMAPHSPCKGTGAPMTCISKETFEQWGMQCVPHIGSTLTAFVYNLVFHGKSSHSNTASFANPTLLDSSKIFGESAPLDLFAITCMSPDLGGKWRRLFSSSKLDGYLPPSTESLELCMKQQVGPSIFVIKIADNHLIGGCSESGMKFGYFLFEIEPYTRIHRSLGAASKYFIKHQITTTNEHGEELKGTGFFAESQDMSPTSSTPTSSTAAGIMKHKPQLFISEHFHWCKGVYLDVPFSSKVQAFEVWGIDSQTNSTGKPAPGVGGGTKPGPKCVAWTNPWKKRFPEYF